MSAEPSSPLPRSGCSLSDALILHRRICLLRASGESTEAAKLERTELAAMLAALRAQGDEASLSAQLAAQESRVAEAWDLAQMIAPLLAARLNTSQFTPVAPVVQVQDSSRRSVARPIRPPATPVLSVADFIEGMLEQERAAAHPS